MSKHTHSKIVIERDSMEPVELDCKLCNLALRDWEDFVSVKSYGICHDCKTNKTNQKIKDN